MVRIEAPTGVARHMTLPCTRSTTRPAEQRPESLAELEPGIWYVDLTRIRAVRLRQAMDTLAKARAVVFDVRGYPTDAGAALLPHLMTSAEDSSDRWMHVSRIVGPFGEIPEWQSFSWNLRPATPHVAGRRVFLTDGRAISYAESVMGYVRDHKLGTIIGGTTAGANGNIADFSVPGGFSIVFTGMRVTRHDARTPFHMVGVPPDIPVEPTLTGIRSGRDEVLERALALLRVQP
jgi:C-terminal processing protease CtpA/Prc